MIARRSELDNNLNTTVALLATTVFPVFSSN